MTLFMTCSLFFVSVSYFYLDYDYDFVTLSFCVLFFFLHPYAPSVTPPPSLVSLALFLVSLHLQPPHVCPVVILFSSMQSPVPVPCCWLIPRGFLVCPFCISFFFFFSLVCLFVASFSQLPFYLIVCLILDFSWLKLAFCLTTCLLVCLAPGSFLSNCHSYITTK